jgi:hypothetical protein
MSRPKHKSLILEPVLEGGASAGPTDWPIKFIHEPAQCSWAAFAVFLFLLVVSFITAGYAFALV